MFTAIFRFFETLIPAYPDTALDTPPKGLKAFCMHYTKGMWPILILTSVITAAIASLEVFLFGFMGQLVDWLVQHDRKDFLQQESEWAVKKRDLCRRRGVECRQIGQVVRARSELD